MKKVLVFTLLVAVFASACMGNTTAGNQPVPSASSVSTEMSVNSTPSASPAEDSGAESTASYTANLRMDESGASISEELKKGDKITAIPNKEGSTFLGYQDQNGTLFVDQDGRVVRGYHGTSDLILTAVYRPSIYTINYINDGVVQRNAFNFRYDEDISSQELQLGAECGDGVFISELRDASGNVIANLDTKTIRLKDMESAIDETTHHVNLNVIASHSKFSWTDLNTYSVDNNGYLKQNLNQLGKSYLAVTPEYQIDLDQLKKANFKSVIINVEVTIKSYGGDQYIKILSQLPADEKTIEQDTILAQKKFSIKEDDKDPTGSKETFQNIVDISKMSSQPYVVFDAGGMFTHKWDCMNTTVDITFSKNDPPESN